MTNSTYYTFSDKCTRRLKLHLKNLNSGKPQVLTTMPTIGGCFLAEQVFPDKDFRHGRERFVSHLSPTEQRD